MALNTNIYGFVIDPLFSFCDQGGKTIANGYVRVFRAGTSTPVLTYRNYDGAFNAETIELDNSGRTMTQVIASKGDLYKVCVYDAEHSQEDPILTVDKVAVIGASVNATNIVQGMNDVAGSGWIKSVSADDTAEISLDATNVTSEVDTMVKATAASADYMMPLVHKTGSDPDKKITLGNIFKFVLNFIHSLTDTATESDIVSGNYFALDGSAGTKKLNSTTLLTKTAQNALVGNVAPAFDPTRTNANPYKAGESVVYTDGKVYTFKVDHYGSWADADVRSDNAIDVVSFEVAQISETTKNLAEIQPKEPTTSSGLTYSFGGKNYIKIAGTTTNVGNNDVSIYLRKAITLPAGKYTISIKGTFVKHNTTTCYLIKDGGSSAGYSSFNDNGVCTITVSSESTILRILIRFNNIQSVSVDGYLQLEAGDAATSFENSTTAIDYKARNDINLFKETTNLVNPIFINGTMYSGAVDLSNTSSCKQWIVTEKIYHINKGSRIDYIGNDSIYFVIAKFAGGSYDSNVLSASFNGSFYFSEDMDVRFAMRKADYSSITPNLASNNLKFSLYAKNSQTSDLNIIFYGLGSGESYLSGQATLFKLPNGKNLLVDSYLESYHNAMANALQAAGVRRIDYYVQTHYHGDHTGILNILRLAPTRIDITGSTFFLPPTITLENIAQVTDNAQTLVDRQTAMENYCTSNGCTIIRPDSTTYYDLGGGVKIKFYNTDHTDYSTPGSGYYSTNYNDWSICPEIFYGLKVVNVSADIGPIAQRKVAGTCFKADILTAPHHGWDNGVNNLIPAYINNISPNVVISQNGKEHFPTNDSSPASVMKASSPMQSYCEANGVPNYMTCLNGPTKVIMSEQSWKFDGTYSRYIRNGKNWSYTDNSEHIEN